MSKYTTEVKYICEVLAGYVPDDSFDAEYDYNSVLSLSVCNKIFGNPNSDNDATYPIFGDDDDKRYELNRKILEHFFTREIGYETVGLWKQKLRFRMREIMPKYNKLYESETLLYSNGTLKLDVLNNVDLKTSRDTTKAENEDVDRTKESKYESTGSKTATTANGVKTETETVASQNGSTISNENTNRDDMQKFSDTPQGQIDSQGNVTLDLDSYLTNATKNKGNEERNAVGTNTNQSNGKSNYSENNSGTSAENNAAESGTNDRENSSKSITGLENYIERMSGKTGDKSYAKMLEEYRSTILNIDAMIIAELEDLFMGIW